MVESFSRKENLKTPDSLLITSGYVRANLFSNKEPLPLFTESLIKEANRRLPGGFILHKDMQQIDPRTSEVKIEFNRDDYPTLESLSERHFKLSGPLDNPELIRQIPYVIYNCSERIRQEQLNLTSLHGVSLVSPDNKGLLVLGDKGGGKTALSIALSMNKGYRLLANDLAILHDNQDRLSILPGSEAMDIRLGVILHYFPALEKYISGEIGKNLYESKISVNPEDIDMSLIKGEFPLIGIVRINIHPFNESFQIEKGAKKEKEQLRLYENLSRYIKGVTTPLALTKNGPLGLFPSIDTKALGEKRDILTQKILDFPDYYYISSNNPITASNAISDLFNEL